MITPPPLHPGDRIAIVSPATIVNPDYIDGAVTELQQQGYAPVVMPHAKGPAHGSYAASDEMRLEDLLDAWRNPEIKAIFCARGGYGCNHLIDKIPADLIADNPKWLIGFSDISALHAMQQAAGVASLHAPMAKHLTELGRQDECAKMIFSILNGQEKIDYQFDSHPLNHTGEAKGTLVGGNLAVINGLADTRFDPMRNVDIEDKILFIEDISEAIYAVERMLIRLRLGGKLQQLKALVCGQFTEYRPDRNYKDMESMIANVTSSLDIPVALGVPVGHTDLNYPLPLGWKADLKVTPEQVCLNLAQG